MAGAEIAYRPPRPEDADQIAFVNREGLVSYREFLGPAWDPPSKVVVPEVVRQMIEEDLPERFWCCAEAAPGKVVGHVAFRDAAGSKHQGGEGVAHLGQLFVLRDFWGYGVAVELLRRAVVEASLRGFTSMQLLAACGQERAFRFYEREGWTAEDQSSFDVDFNAETIWFRRQLP